MAITTIEEAFEYLDEALSQEEKKDLKTHDVVEFHHTLGRHLRNYLKLWNVNSLTKMFRRAYEIVHADDISSLILHAYQAKLLNKEFSIYFEAINYRNHWRSLNLFNKMLQEFDEKVLLTLDR